MFCGYSVTSDRDEGRRKPGYRYTRLSAAHRTDDLCGVSSSALRLRGREGAEDGPCTPRRGWREPVRCGTLAAPLQSYHPNWVRPEACSTRAGLERRER